MTALHALGQQGGWPLTMFLSPDGQPMLGGTYWPPEPRWGRPSFRQVLESVDAAWRTRREEMERRGLTLTDHLATLSTLSPGPGVTPAEVARLPVQPGNSDLCFEWMGSIADAIAHLERCGVGIVSGPLRRFGAKGAGTSVYFRDPDGSLMEFMSYGA